MNGRDILMVTIATGIGILLGIMLCGIYPFLTNSLGFNTKENLRDASHSLVLSPLSSTADPEEALFGNKIAISFNDTGYTTKAEQFFNNICDFLNRVPNFNFDFCLENQIFHVSDVFGAPGHLPVHSGVVLTNPHLQLNIHIDPAPHSFNPLDQKFNVIHFKVTKGLVQGQFRGYTSGSLKEIIETVKLSMNALGNNYSVLENNCIRFKDILVKQLTKCPQSTVYENIIKEFGFGILVCLHVSWVPKKATRISNDAGDWCCLGSAWILSLWELLRDPCAVLSVVRMGSWWKQLVRPGMNLSTTASGSSIKTL